MSSQAYSVGPASRHQHTHTIILLHGRDSAAHEFAAELFESEASVPANCPRTLLDLLPTVRWVFPSATLLPSARFGVPLSQWFDIWSVENPNEQVESQLSGLRSSVDAILRIVAVEEATLGRASVFLGGISQGFVTAVAAFLDGGKDYAGLIGMSSWMPPTIKLPAERCAAEVTGHDGNTVLDAGPMRRTPVFLTHNTDDEAVPLQNGRTLRDALRAHGGLDVEWHEYGDGGHWVNEPQGVDDLISFLRAAGVPYHDHSS